MDNCIFCKIIKGEIPCHKIYEDDDFIAFLDIRPLNKGHTLIIPKKHIRWVYEVENHGEYWNVAKKLANAIVKCLEPLYVMFITFGTEVPHAHIHVVPRYENDGHPGLVSLSNVKEISETEMKEIVEKIKDNL